MLGVQVCTNLPWGGQWLAIVKTNSQRKNITLAAREGPEFLYNALVIVQLIFDETSILINVE